MSYKVQRVGFGLRFLAHVIDMLLVYVGAYTVGGVVAIFLVNIFGGAGDTFLLSFILGYASFFIVSPLYYLVEVFTGKTVGKFLLGLEICNAYAHSPASKSELIKRYCLKNLVCLGVCLTGIISVLITQAGQSWASYPLYLVVIVIYAATFVGGIVLFFGNFGVFGIDNQTLYDKLSATAVAKTKDIQIAAAEEMRAELESY
jgi:uncharacterized RDD family membrane protein YckC